ncbi:alpha/beta hydrolase, partial [Xanthomonas oryzae pv. oryzae]
MSSASPISPATPRRNPRAQATAATADVLLVHGIWNTTH